MSGQDYEQLTLFREVSPASPSPWLESKKEKGTTVTCGRKCFELSESLRRVGSSVRTYLESCKLPLPTLYRTWSVKAITSQCLLLKLRLSARRTDEKGFSSSALWKTPVTADSGNREFYRNSRGEPNLSGQVKIAQSGPAPKCARLWPTPKAQNATGAGNPPNRRGGPDLQTVVSASDGQLNPDWVEWLMGFPVGWTSLTSPE